MTHRLIFFLLLLLLAGCQKTELDPADDNRPNADGSIGFRLTTDDAAIEPDGAESKGIAHNTLEKYNTVYVNVYSHTLDYEQTVGNDVELFREIELAPKDSKWEYTPHMFWPAAKKLSFMAYASDIAFAKAGISFAPATDAPDSIKYSVPKEVANQPDLLVSTLFNHAQADNVFLTMKHALACVSFCGDSPDKSVYVKSITLRNVCGIGSLALNSSEIKWKLDESNSAIKVLEAGIKDDEVLQQAPTSPNYLMTETGYLMMLPQKLKNAAIDVLYWNGTDDKGNKIVTYMLPTEDPAYAAWKPGQKYVYKFGTQSEDVTVVYYEKYADNSYGLYYYEEGQQQNTIVDKVIEEAGYGILTKKSIGKIAGIRLSDPTSAVVTSGAVVELAADSFLYPVSQSAASTFFLPRSTIPQNVYFNGSAKSCGMIVPHFAKGVYTSAQTAIKTHSIRTPQQMRNITQSDASSTRNTHTYTQDLDLDFSKEAIGGGRLTTAVVNRQFNDKFEGQSKRIENVTIEALANGALFRDNGGEINNVLLVNSSISASVYTGGIVAANQKLGIIFHPRIIGEDDGAKLFRVKGTTGYVGAVAGYNYGTITGNTTIDNATELPVAEVSGWASIEGVSTGTGGITGENDGTITTCLVQGVFVTGTNKGDAVISKITIDGGHYVGGIVGVNKSNIHGNNSLGPGGISQAEPDLAGLVSVTGNDFVGGIAGQNSGTLDQVNVRLGRGDANNAMIIKGNQSVGGIVGYNTGTLQTNAKSFISVRGNVHISGTDHVGGIVGNNQGGNIANCFVFNFYSQNQNPLIHYAPKITGDMNVGGIAGYAGKGEIKQCVVFSTVSPANSNGGDVGNAVTEIKARTRSVGGIVGNAFSELTITSSCVLGNVKVDGVTSSGGIMGENNIDTHITSVHIGNSGQAISDIYDKLFKVLNLPVYDTRMQTGGGVMTTTSGTPTIVGTEYIGGICGLNLGTIDGVLIKDNVKIGTTSSTYVGGIAGGNVKAGTIKNCITYNPADNTAASVTIIADAQVGGIVGINNGVVEGCKLGLDEAGKSRLITIDGRTKLGGIAGSNGGHETGDANTRITNCNVYGKVLIKATSDIVGGILGENGRTNRVENCNVIGYASSGTNANGYDITVKGSGHVGGIAGSNYGDIHGASASSYSKVTRTAVIASNMYAGGLVGFQQSTAEYRGSLYYCDVAQGVLIHFLEITSGALVGQLDGAGGTSAAPILFGTTLGGRTNRIYTGKADPVIVSANNRSIIVPPLIEDITKYPEVPMEPNATTGNLWTRFLDFNYLHYTAYQ